MTIKQYLSEYGIELCGVLPLSSCRIQKPWLLERAGFNMAMSDQLFAVIFAVPYLTPDADRADRNLSAYAISEDYHVFFAQLYEQLLSRLRSDFPENHHAAFVDHSPIDEIDAAIRAGLGIRGKHHLLLTERYSSYVFLGEIITDLPLAPTPTSLPSSSLVCHDCGACQKACPMQTEGGECRSALTQKKGVLTEEEKDLLTRFPGVWGCDICQEVCPYTAHARQRGTIYTTIPFFHQNTITRLTSEELDAMSEEAFARRAYAWRGKDVIRRNLLLKQALSDTSEKPEV